MNQYKQVFLLLFYDDLLSILITLSTTFLTPNFYLKALRTLFYLVTGRLYWSSLNISFILNGWLIFNILLSIFAFIWQNFISLIYTLFNPPPPALFSVFIAIPRWWLSSKVGTDAILSRKGVTSWIFRPGIFGNDVFWMIIYI